ncbi:MAG: diacylglycerol kinase family protein [Acidobacteriota bacterium]
MIRVLVNPAAGRRLGGRGLDRLAELAAGVGAPCEVSRNASDLTLRARRAAADGVERLLVAGGDGTLHHAIQGLAGSGCALGVIPLGTGNDLASALGSRRGIAQAIEYLTTAPVGTIDLGRIGPPGEPKRCFSVYAGVGFDSEVAERAHQGRRFLSGKAVYLWSVLRTLVDFEPPTLRIEHDQGAFEGPAMFVTVANGPCFGGGMKIAPAARLDDGFFDLVVVRRVSCLALLRVFPRVYRGTHVSHPAVTIVRTRRARLESDRPLTAYADGEPAAALTGDGLEVEIEPGGLRVI